MNVELLSIAVDFSQRIAGKKRYWALAQTTVAKAIRVVQ